MPMYRDIADYRGREVPLLKRAQLTAADLALALGGSGLGRFHDLDRLSAFADNPLPHVLRSRACSSMNGSSCGRSRREVLHPGGPRDVEIRASTIQAVERIVALLSRMGETTPRGKWTTPSGSAASTTGTRPDPAIGHAASTTDGSRLARDRGGSQASGFPPFAGGARGPRGVGASRHRMAAAPRLSFSHRRISTTRDRSVSTRRADDRPGDAAWRSEPAITVRAGVYTGISSDPRGQRAGADRQRATCRGAASSGAGRSPSCSTVRPRAQGTTAYERVLAAASPTASRPSPQPARPRTGSAG